MAFDGTQLVVAPDERYSERYARAHLGASQWATAIGENPFEAQSELWEVFVGQRLAFTGNEATELGHALEDGVSAVAAKKLGLEAFRCFTVEHPEQRWLCCTPDRVLSTGNLQQVKTTGLATRQSWTILDEVWTEDLDGVPDHVFIQCMAELFVARAAFAIPGVRALACPGLDESAPLPTKNHVAALIPGRGVCLYEIEWDPDLALALFGRVCDFWRYVLARKLPPPDASPAYGRVVGRTFPTYHAGRWLDGDDLETTMMALQYQQAIAARDFWTRAVELTENAWRVKIGPHEGVRGAWGSIPYRSQRRRGGPVRRFGPPRFTT